MRISTLLALGVLSFAGTPALAQDITYDYDRAADFSRFKTYAWTGDSPVSDELIHKRIVTAVDSQLALKGLSRVEPDAAPDVLVSYQTVINRSLQVTGLGSGRRYGWSHTGSARVGAIQTGVLTVDLFDGRTRSIVWRATATRDLDLSAGPEKRDKNIRRAAERLFKHYPPGN